MRYIFLGGLACLLSATFCLSATTAQEPALAPAPEPENAATNTIADTTETVIGNGSAYGGPIGNCQVNGRFRYCRPEPFSRNDCRDQYLFSAPGYGVPVTVPMAPVVCRQYNYGWGLPASRLTHIPAGWQAYRPHAPRGRGGAPSRPMVYWPNDTMQQGYYYMRTPW